MIYKNSFKITMSNFGLVSKTFLLFAFNMVIVFGLGYVIALPIFNLLDSFSWFENLKNINATFLQGLDVNVLFTSLANHFKEFILILTNNFTKIGFNIFALIFMIVFVGHFLNSFFTVTLTNSLYNYMSNHVKMPFFTSYVSMFYYNLKFALLSIISKLPFNLIIIFSLVLVLKLFSFGGAIAFFTPFILILVGLGLTSLRLTIFSSWGPSMVIFNDGVAGSINKGISITLRKVSKVFANSFYIVLTIFVLNVFCAIVTMGVSLIITIPMSLVLVNSFSLVVFYENYGMRYYTDEFNFIVPTKLENSEPKSRVKFII